MLVIRRRAGEAILVGKDIEIQVIEVAGGRVKLGISAPQEVIILRKEIRWTADENMLAAAGMREEAAARLAAALRR